MAYLDAYIKRCPAYGWQGGPTFKTRIVEMRNGRERRNAEWAQARHAFSAPFRNIQREEYANIKQMHLVCRGMLHSFKFRDQLDYEATNEVFAQGNGVAKVFQLRKISTIDGVSYTRETHVIRDGSTIRVNGAVAAHTVDQDRGLVTFAVAPINGALISGTWQFDVWVRFNQDDLPFSVDSGNASGQRFITGSIDLIEVPAPPL